jgi:Na+-translocating ferredoxin:NAD+ oxidoreductase subunit D
VADTAAREGKSRTASSPHIAGPRSAVGMVWAVTLCLLPAGAWGAIAFGPRALLVLAVSVASALAAEALTGLAFRRFTLWDGSALLTGLLIGYLMPPAVPLYVPAAASVFAIAVVKETFGGLGRNWMNPAAAGRVFAMFSWSAGMAAWTLPRAAASSAAPAASPLAALAAALADPARPRGDPLDILLARGYPFSSLDSSVIGWINTHVLSPLGAPLRRGWLDLLLGNTAGTIGEVGVLLLLAGAAWLLVRGVIRWEIPAVFLGSFVVLTWVFGGMATGAGPFAGNVVFHLLTGGTVLAAFFMATDPVTSPLTFRGRIVYAGLLGVLAFLLRFFGSFPEGVSLAVVLANTTVPLLDTWRKR